MYSSSDRRQYSTTREGGAESLQGLTETAGLPKYHTIFGPGFFFAGTSDTRRIIRQQRWKACPVGRLCRSATGAETGMTTGSGTR